MKVSGYCAYCNIINYFVNIEVKGTVFGFVTSIEFCLERVSQGTVSRYLEKGTYYLVIFLNFVVF